VEVLPQVRRDSVRDSCGSPYSACGSINNRNVLYLLQIDLVESLKKGQPTLAPCWVLIKDAAVQACCCSFG
jgi:hypothetical protein